MFNYQKQKGVTLIIVLVFTSIFMIVGIGLLQLVGTLYKTAIKKQNSEKAFQIAEAGVNYYKWRLSHAPDDYTGSGDYDYYDPYGGKIGHYNLQITQPPLGTSVVTVNSIGYIDDVLNMVVTTMKNLAFGALEKLKNYGNFLLNIKLLQ